MIHSKLLLATSNPGKILEMKECLAGLPFAFLTLQDLPKCPPQPEESGTSHEENAILKARYYFSHAKIPTIAEDSGIHVEALEGELGIHTRRWGAGPDASDAEWIEYFLKRMRQEKNKRAYFHCVVALACSSGDELCHAEPRRSILRQRSGQAPHDDIVVRIFEGKCEGIITDTLEASYLPGLPISGCFRPNGFSTVFSALSIEQKNSSSHRGRAMGKVREWLKNEG